MGFFVSAFLHTSGAVPPVYVVRRIIWMHGYIHTHTHIYIYIYMSIYIYICMYVYVCIYIYIHTHTHLPLGLLSQYNFYLHAWVCMKKTNFTKSCQLLWM